MENESGQAFPMSAESQNIFESQTVVLAVSHMGLISCGGSLN